MVTPADALYPLLLAPAEKLGMTRGGGGGRADGKIAPLLGGGGAEKPPRFMLFGKDQVGLKMGLLLQSLKSAAAET